MKYAHEEMQSCHAINAMKGTRLVRRSLGVLTRLGIREDSLQQERRRKPSRVGTAQDKALGQGRPRNLRNLQETERTPP